MPNKIAAIFTTFSIVACLSIFSYADFRNQEDFDSSIQQVFQQYSPLVQSLGGQLRIDSQWKNDTLNGFAERDGDLWIIKIFGGLFRHPLLTTDGFQSLLCHELGHHLGGAPYKFDIPWMSTEGQADFYSGSVCLIGLWENKNNLHAIKDLEIPPEVSKKCSIVFEMEERVALCIRIALAGFSFTEFNRVEHGYTSENSPSDFSNPAPVNTSGKSLTYPRAQCRLDTYLAAALNQKPPACW